MPKLAGSVVGLGCSGAGVLHPTAADRHVPSAPKVLFNLTGSELPQKPILARRSYYIEKRLSTLIFFCSTPLFYAFPSPLLLYVPHRSAKCEPQSHPQSSISGPIEYYHPPADGFGFGSGKHFRAVLAIAGQADRPQAWEDDEYEM